MDLRDFERRWISPNGTHQIGTSQIKATYNWNLFKPPQHNLQRGLNRDSYRDIGYSDEEEGTQKISSNS